MDLDGLAAEVVYCEVSAFRFLYLMREGGTDATRAFNDTLHAYASVDPIRLIVSYQIPIHDIDFAISEVQRVASFGGKSLQLPVFPSSSVSPTTATPATTRCGRGARDGTADLLPHRHERAVRQPRDPRPDTATGALVPLIALSSAEAMGMWILGGVFERFP
jgi:hypothetical protein